MRNWFVHTANLLSITLSCTLHSKVKMTRSSKKKDVCPQCKGEHLLTQCPMFLSSTAQVRDTLRRSLGLCRACLKYPHGRDCVYNICAICSSPARHTLLHISIDQRGGQRKEAQTGQASPESSHADLQRTIDLIGSSSEQSSPYHI